MKPIRNAFSVDVEEYFQVEAFSDIIPREQWDTLSPRAERQTRKTLELLGSRNVRGTYFVLGWMAEKNPSLVRDIHDAGHEIASHGFSHKMVTKMSPKEFREDVRRAKRVLEDITRGEVQGYRAPTFSIVRDTSWAYGILLDEGYRYSSSVYPIRHDRYGWPAFGREPRKMASNGKGEIWEMPMTVGTIGPFRVPFGGGGYLRLYPLAVTNLLFRSLEKEGRPAVLYMHPWELDAEMPRVRTTLLRRLRHYVGIRRMENKLISLLDSRSFGTLRHCLEERIARNSGRKEALTERESE